MNDRFERLWSLEKNLYSPGCPLIVRAGALLRDKYTKNLLAQLKFRNISGKTVKAVKLRVNMLDTAGEMLGEPLEYRYIDLNALRDDEFGSSTAIILPDSQCRSFSLVLDEVLFDDGSPWQAEDTRLRPLKPFRTLAESLGDTELASQYRIRYGANCLYEPMEDMDIWLCTCGAVNSRDEKSCHSCRRVLTALKDVNTDSLRSECSERLKAEELRDTQEQAEKKLKNKKLTISLAIIIPLLAAVILCLCFVPGAVRRSEAYTKAGELLSAGEFDKALQMYEKLGDYKDSPEIIKSEIPYQRAIWLMTMAENEDISGLKLLNITQASLSDDDRPAVLMYEAASEAFKALGNYKKSEEYSESCLAAIDELNNSEQTEAYENARELLAQGSYCEARDAFEELGDFRDSSKMAQEAIYQKALALFKFMEEHDIRQLFAGLSIETGKESVFALSEQTALDRGQGFIKDLTNACGKDKSDIRLTDEPEKALVPFEEALSKLFSSLGSYRDSSKYPEKIAEHCDYTREFFNYVSSGDVYGAYQWLEAYDGEFENRRQWQDTLSKYMPFCSSWELHSGDSTLIPLSQGLEGSCYSIDSCVIIEDDCAVLRISYDGKPIAEFKAELGELSFYYDPDNGYVYLAAISVTDRLAFMKYSNNNLISSCDYTKVY